MNERPQDWNRINQDALAALMPLVYEELRRLAKNYMRRERPGHTLATTGLVHEAYLRLLDQEMKWESRAHFIGVAAQTMRRILVDYAKKRNSAKRGGGSINLPLEQFTQISGSRQVDLVALDEALDRLQSLDPLWARIVELRFFGGLSNEEASQVLEVSTATVQRHWAGARAWLYHELKHGESLVVKESFTASGGNTAAPII